MTVVSWCAQNNVNAKSYYYWLRKIRSMVCETGELSIRSNEQQIVPLTFKQTKVINYGSHHDTFAICFCGYTGRNIPSLPLKQFLLF